MLRERAKNDDGIALILVALCLVALMVFTAFAVDLGATYSERRINQNSADAAAMSGAVQLLKTQSRQTAVDEILAKVDGALDRSVPAADWVACTDANRLASTAASLGLTPATDCISFSASKVRVRIPDQVVSATFGRVVGIDEFTTSAFAEATYAPLGGGALPFVVLAGAANGDQICLRTSGNNSGGQPPQIPPTPYNGAYSLDPCDETNNATSQGARGTLLPNLYEQGCKISGNQSIVDAIMVGMDHMLGTYQPPVTLAPGADANALDSDPRTIEDDTDCPTPFPNAVAVDTGFTSPLLYCALLLDPCTKGSSGVTSTRGRLRSPGSPASFNGAPIDDIPLWDYFVSPLPGTAPAACADADSGSSGGASFYDRRAAMGACLAAWTPSAGVLFTSDIANSPRIGFVPRVAELGVCRTQPNPAPPAGGCGGGPAPKHVHVNTFTPVFIDGVYYATGGECDGDNPATQGSNWTIHYPGKAGGLDCSTGGKDEVSRLSGTVLPCGSLPPEVCDTSPSGPFPDLSGITRVRLSK